MKKMKLPLTVLVSLMIVSSCSSGNPTTPNKANLTNLAKTPSSTPEAELKKINLTGRVIDSVTRKPVDGATVLLYVISSDEVMKKVKEGLKGISESPSPSPQSSNASASPNPDESPSVESSPNTLNSNTLPISPINSASPSPLAIPNVTKTSNPVALEENEEKSENVVKSPTPFTSASVPSAKEILNNQTTKDISKVPKPNTLATPIPSVSPSSLESTDKSEVSDISADLLSSALTNLKLNDIQEFNGKTGNDGKFWINKVPDTSVIITINAPNYKTVSIFNLDTSKVEDIVIDPIQIKDSLFPVRGNVYSATNSPVNGANISASYNSGDLFSIPVNSDTSGDFKLEDVKEGERTFLASVKEPSGKITSLGMIDFEVKKGQKATKPEEKMIIKPVETKVEVKALETKEEPKMSDKKEDSPIARDRNIPNIKVKSVTEYLDFKGKIEKSEINTLKSINAYIVFKKKNMPKEEVFLTDMPIEAGTENFDISLPKLESGYSYHLEFVAVNKKGTYIYHHVNSLKKSDKEIKLSFIDPLTTGKVDFLEKDGEKIPVFTWTPVSTADFYRISLDKMDKDNKITTVWEGITPFNTAVYPITTGDGKLSSSNKYFWNVVAIKEGTSASERISYSKLNVNTWTDLASSPNMEFSLSGNKEEDIEEIESKKEG